MRTNYPTMLAAVFSAGLFSATTGHAQAVTVGFEDIGASLGTEGYWQGQTRFEDTGEEDGIFVSQGVTFYNHYDKDTPDKRYWDGWAYSNTSDTTTAGHTNQFSATTGTGAPDPAFGASSPTYSLAYHGFMRYNDDYTECLGIPTLDLPENSQLLGAYFTNTTYAVQSMLHGDSFAKIFGDDSRDSDHDGEYDDAEDWFKLVITGLDAEGNETGSTEFYLADYRFSDNSQDYIVTDWQWVDLSVLNDPVQVQFTLGSSDVGTFGPNTPFYFAMDSLTLQTVPEPTSFLLIAVAAVMLGGWYCRLKKRSFRVFGWLPACLVLACSGTALAGDGPYSQYANDPTNPYDAPVSEYDARIVSWADTVVDYRPAPGVGTYKHWQTHLPVPEVGYQAPTTGTGSLGDLYDPTNPPATGTKPTYHGVDEVFGGDVNDLTDSYGFLGIDTPGTITVGFATAIRNGSGADFAVFENGFFSDQDQAFYAELAYVEVSTNGTDFVQFPSVSLTTEGDLKGSRGYAALDETKIYNLAGKHGKDSSGTYWGTPFDLDDLVDQQAVTNGLVDLEEINFVRLVDIPGSGDFSDSATQLIDPTTGLAYTEDHGILDAWVTYDSSGFDFQLSRGVAAINAVPEPGSLILLLVSALALWPWLRRRGSK